MHKHDHQQVAGGVEKHLFGCPCHSMGPLDLASGGQICKHNGCRIVVPLVSSPLPLLDVRIQALPVDAVLRLQPRLKTPPLTVDGVGVGHKRAFLAGVFS